MSRRKPSAEDLAGVYRTCRRGAAAMLTLGALHSTWATSDEEAERAKAREAILEVLVDCLGDDDRTGDIIASVREAYEVVDTREGTPEERYDGPVTDILLDAMAACILNAFDEVMTGIKGERE